MPVRPRRMNAYSSRFVDALRAAGDPAVRSMADRAVDEDAAMRVGGVSPGGHAYYVTTASGNEVTIGLGRHWHVHLDEFGSWPDDEEPFAKVIRFLSDLVGERLVVVERHRAGRYVGSGAVRPGDASHEPGGTDRRVTISWAGTHDADSAVG